MLFSEKLKKTMEDLGISQTQLAGMTGIGKSSICQYLSGRNIPTKQRQEHIATSLGLASDYFKPDELKLVMTPKAEIACGVIQKLEVEDAAKLLGMNHNTVRKGLQQGVFPWGYAIHTSANRWVYFINAKRFAEIERLTIQPV